MFILKKKKTQNNNWTETSQASVAQYYNVSFYGTIAVHSQIMT